MSEKFVVIWAISRASSNGDDQWVMVRHKDRGWELPGGQLVEGETEDFAALRELYEETGMLGVAKAVDFGLIQDGCVVLVEVEQAPRPESWQSSDDSIEEVGWCITVPENCAWGADEIERIRAHDWSASITLES
ncbi:MAG: NUDIX domain-containing protein [Candidatus Thalassarchaeaceae archaeon]|nr:NUDIX domain-containing protein [Candidatus Thalassarchaeaceae archaeon]